jgi:4-carboxymuconolactone decarboxylase
MDGNERYRHGMQTRRQVLGDDHVDAAMARTSDLGAPFQEYVTGAAWADVWGRPGLDRPTRSLVTIALLAALGHERELDLHLHASRRTGATPEQIAETLLHVGLYAGAPAANAAFAALERIFGADRSGSDDGEEGL